MSDLTLPGFPGYDTFLRDVKQRIQMAQIKAAVAVNAELVLLYWSIGRDIPARQHEQGWGAKVIQCLSADLRRAFPEMKGFSRTNLLYMRAFAESYPDEAIVQQAAGQISWFHNCILLDKVKSNTERLWDARAVVEHGWSRNVLAHQIETNLYARLSQTTVRTGWMTCFQRRMRSTSCRF